MKKHLKWGALALSMLGLTACGSITNQTPDEMYRTSIQRQFKQDTQYNFTGKVFAQILPSESGKDLKNQSRTEALNDYIERETSIAKWRYHDNLEMQRPDKIRERAEKKLASKEMLTKHFANSLSIPISGAWDLPNGKFEIVPEIRYETRNSATYAKLPIQINAKQASILIDPAAISPFIDMYAVERKDAFEAINNRYVRITMPEKLQKSFPLKDVFSSLPKALDDAHAMLDKSSFTALPLDERAKKWGASHRILYKSNSQQDDAYVAALFKSVLQQLEEKQKNGTTQTNIPAENYAKFIDGMKAIAEEVEKSSKEVSKVSENEKPESFDDILKNMTVDSEVYLDNKGRMLAYVQSIDLPNELTDKLFYGERLRIMSEMVLEYNKQPVFVIQPNENNTVDLEKISPDFIKTFSDALSEN